MSPAGYQYLRRQLDDLLLNVWDPIGVKDIKEARDEYSAYAAQISHMLISGLKDKSIFEHLREIECVHMGLSQTDEARTKAVSEFCVQLLNISEVIQ